MTNLRSFISGFKQWLLVSGLAVSAFAQTSEPSKSPPEALAPQKIEKRVSTKEAEELFRSVDEILNFVSKDTGLPIRSQVKRQLASREEVQKYVEEKMAEDEDQKRLERAELVLKKFGLLPRDFQLRRFMITLLKEQVAGFYDSKRKTVHLLDWIGMESQKPVLAHELTHALQDQTIDLDQWAKDARERAKKSPDRETAEIELDEEISARTALLEGQGMAVLLDYILAPQGRSLKDSPQFAEALKVSMSAGTGSPVLDTAPLLLRESLIFPYRDGLGFIQALLEDGGSKKAYPDALRDPPRNTRDVMTPKSYLEKQMLPDLKMPELGKVVGKNYEKYDTGSIGQFDIFLIAKQFSSNADAKELSPEWRGGYYYSALKKNAAKHKVNATGDLGLMYVSRWSSTEMAQRFADLYARSFKLKYKNAVQDSGKWRSEEGPMTIEVKGESLLVLEGFDDDTAAKLREAVWKSLPNVLPKYDGSTLHTGNLSLKTVSPVFAVRLMMHQ